jgi:hypothetical protein
MSKRISRRKNSTKTTVLANRPSSRVPQKKKTQVRKASPRVTRAIAKMRKQGVSLRKAARELKVSPRTVLKNAASALRKGTSGRYSAKSSDRLVRVMMIPTPEGPQEISVRGLPAASLLGSYWSSLHVYYETGKDSALKQFSGKFITAVGGKKYPLLTDLEILNRLGSAGVVSFESLYARS